MNRPLSKLAPVRKVEGGSERRTGVYTPVHEDSSTEPTHKFSTEVEFRKGSNIKQSALGKKSPYPREYNPELLFSIPREEKRLEIGISSGEKSFFGYDLWNHYEVSWLNAKGKPMIAHAILWFDCHSPNIIESKSMKLYFNSFNHTRFQSIGEFAALVKKDLTKAVGSEVFLQLIPFHEFQSKLVSNHFSGINIDHLDIECDEFIVDPTILKTEKAHTTETLCSDLLKSNCLVTYQPDWGSIQIHYTGPQIDHESLLKYLISFRDHNEFHEQCIERIFMDLKKYCRPQKLSVYGRYTRRGGLDINPYRSTEKNFVVDKELRLLRQ